MMIMAIPHMDLVQDSEGDMPANVMLVQNQQASEGGPVPIQELIPQRQLDHIHTSVDVIDTLLSIATEHSVKLST